MNEFMIIKSLKCGICEIHACKDCHMVKEEEHKCNPDTVATVKFLATDTKPCPACRCLIHKIHGWYCVAVQAAGCCYYPPPMPHLTPEWH